MTPSFGGDQFSGGHQALFIGEAERFACLDCLIRGFQSGDAHDRADNEIGFGMSCYTHVPRRAINNFDLRAS